MHNLNEKLRRYMNAGFPLLYITSFEEEKCDRVISEAAEGRDIIEWSEATGFTCKEEGISQEMSLIDLLHMVLTQEDSFDNRVLVLKNIHKYLEDTMVIALLKEFVKKINTSLDCCVIIVSPVCVLPKELECMTTLLELDAVDRQEIERIIADFVEEQEAAMPSDKLITELADAFKGLSEYEIKNILALALAEDGEINRGDLKLIFEQKNQMIKKSGILEMIRVEESIDDIGGLEVLKSWLKRKAAIFKDIDKAQAFGVDFPKGVLIAGMPGCGKSLSAKAVASLFEMPLVRMDLGRLMGKYVGESEANMRKAIALAEAISPCVLWIDELEKAFAGVGMGNGSEVTTRLFGTFLTWLQEKKSMTFVVATANNIATLPPELLRKGRFDQTFYVALPDKDERKKIFSIHLKKRKQLGDKIDLNKLADKTDGFSGSDIESVVKDSVESAFVNNKKQLTTEDILYAVNDTCSLKATLKDNLAKIEEFYENNNFKKASKGDTTNKSEEQRGHIASAMARAIKEVAYECRSK